MAYLHNLKRRLLTNRYDPKSNWITVKDVILNAKEIHYCWSHRLPKGTKLRWDGDRIVGHYTTRS